ncbi:ATP-binding cassette domain-containing protein [Candidatus Bathyarchaeota archaeon]|nr:ATP-binding cassette domain-containing protein [Candidatus Bathyarchaeota archaeon]
MPDPVIEVDSVNITRKDKTIIEEADFTIEQGTYMGVVGPNGGGKTTLMQGILGIMPLEKGSIKILGTPIQQFEQWNKLAFVSQYSINFNEKFPLTVRELVGLGRINKTNLGRPLKNDDWNQVDEAIEFMGITQIANRRIGQLSGGQKQRVFVAKAIVRKPQVLILDEPASGIDPEAQEKFYMILSNLNQEERTTILIVSHDLAAVFCRMSHVMCINKKVYTSPITPDNDPNEILRKAYGEHFRFVMHEHICEGVFDV